MIPSRRFVLLLALGVVPFLAALAFAEAAWAGVAWDLALALLLGIDLAAAPRPCDLEAAREVEGILSLAAPAEVVLALRWHGRREALVDLVDASPDGFAAPGRRARVRLLPDAEHRVGYRVVPHGRGEHRFGDLHLRLSGPLGLAWRRHVVPLSEAVQVYPDLGALVRGGAAAAASERAGLRRTRRRGEGREFDALREYVPGDDVRTLDWKATARRGAPITREYRPEQHQDVVLLVDCGRQMRPKVGNHTKLDHAVNAALTLAHVALSRGDRVGLVVFDHEVRAFLPPRPGREQLMRLVDALHHVRPTLTESDYHAAYDALARRALRRALVVTFTDVQAEEASRDLLARTRLLRTRHLPLVVAVADADLARVAAQVPATREDAYRRVAASRMVHDRQAVVRRLVSGGALVVDAPAGELTARAVERYLEVKARGRL